MGLKWTCKRSRIQWTQAEVLKTIVWVQCRFYTLPVRIRGPVSDLPKVALAVGEANVPG